MTTRDTVLMVCGVLGAMPCLGSVAPTPSSSASPPLGISAPREQVTAILRPVKDNTLCEDPAGALSNGGASDVFAGLTGTGQKRRALLAFDVAGTIPPGALIESAALKLYLSRDASDERHLVSLHRVLADWGEGTARGVGGGGLCAPAGPGDATWIHRSYQDALWGTAGGDFSPLASATQWVGIGFDVGWYFSWSSPELAADVQGWLDDPASDHGWIVIGAEPPGGGRTAKRFESRESSDLLTRPLLKVVFTPPPDVGACCLSQDVCAFRTPADCQSQGGAFQGAGAPCSPGLCQPPTGACCFPGEFGGSCGEFPSTECSGAYQGDRTSCQPGTCFPTGACCASTTDACFEASSSFCEAYGDVFGARYGGDGSECGGDADADSIPSPCDNCDAVANEDQTDTDGDGTGDACECGPAVDCDDDNRCTDDSCESATGCVHAFLSGPCSDDNACTVGDTCGDGVCRPGRPIIPKIDCNDGNACTRDGCDPDLGCLNAPVLCRDDDPRTIDTCNPARGCVFIRLAPGDALPAAQTDPN